MLNFTNSVMTITYHLKLAVHARSCEWFFTFSPNKHRH